jgi:uroporphyrinogen decarboxylase
MQKQERLSKTIAGEPTDRSPAALWRHFPGDDLRAADLAYAVMDYQRAYDWDMIVLLPSSTYAQIDYGIQEVWDGCKDGERIVTRCPIQKSLEWTELRPLDPSRGSLARQIEAARLISEALPDTPLVLALHSPLDQAQTLAGKEALLKHLRTQSDRLRSGLNILTENLLRFLEALRKLPLAGICLVANSACYSLLSEEEYRTFGLPYDRRILDAAPRRAWLNMLRLGGEIPMIKLMSGLPVQALQWRDKDREPDLTYGKSLAPGAVCGGLSSINDLFAGTPTTVRDAARDALQRTNHRRLILSTGSPLYLATPASNLRAAREAVDSSRGES